MGAFSREPRDVGVKVPPIAEASPGINQPSVDRTRKERDVSGSINCAWSELRLSARANGTVPYFTRRSWSAAKIDVFGTTDENKRLAEKLLRQDTSLDMLKKETRLDTAFNRRGERLSHCVRRRDLRRGPTGQAVMRPLT